MSNEELDKAVAKAQGWELKHDEEWHNNYGFECWFEEYHPSTNWQQCGELIEKYKLSVGYGIDDLNIWYSGYLESTDSIDIWKNTTADTPQRAICMAVIAMMEGAERKH